MIETENGRIYTTLDPYDYLKSIGRKPRKERIPVSPKLRLELISQVENICESCSGYYPTKVLEIHHIDGDPSNDDLDNLEVLCANCHRSKTGEVEDDE